MKKFVPIQRRSESTLMLKGIMKVTWIMQETKSVSEKETTRQGRRHLGRKEAFMVHSPHHTIT